MAAARLPNLGEMAIAPLFIGPFAAGLTERDGNFSQICRGETRNKAERNERNILTLVTKCRFAPTLLTKALDPVPFDYDACSLMCLPSAPYTRCRVHGA